MDDVLEPESSTTFTVLKQKLELDFSFSPRRIKGKATLEIQPQDETLRYIQLNCRQLKITSVKVEGRDAMKTTSYSNLYDRLSLYPGTGVQQHHFLKSRIHRHATGGELELEVIVPDAVKIRRMNPEDATADQIAANVGADGGNLYTPIKLEIEYVVENPRDAIHFVGVEDGDARYPHAYTRNSPYPGIASCLFPCIDDGVTKCIYEISIRYPRTLGDIWRSRKGQTSGASASSLAQTDNSPKADSVMSDVDEDPAEFTEEEKTLEISVICSGELTDDISDQDDTSRRTATFNCVTPVLPQHIGIAIGPFEHVDLSEYRDTQDDERLGSNAIRVHAFSLPGRADEVRNSAMMLARTLDSFTEKYQSYPFEKAYKLAFVDDLECDVAHSASFSICSSRLLFPETVWEPLESTTRALVHAVASQWIGVNVTPQRPSDHWVIVGGSWFMAELYLRELFGRNDHRFRQKLMSDRILQLDVRRPSLFILGEYLPVDPGEMEFMTLKAPMVLAILHHRLVKQSGKNGVDRCLYRLLFNARNEKLPNGIVSTEAFLDICEKVGHQKLDTFFNQWIYGSGCPTFECHPVFNKKKQVIQLTIKQTQADPTLRPEDRAVAPDEVLREAKEKVHGFRPNADWPAFVGPMTIRIHEADGTPYEHIVEINSSMVKVEIPYNTKYKRLKKTRREKERAAAQQGLDASGEAQEDQIIYKLGELFQSEEEFQEWKISDWSPEDENRMDQEFYEWIRIDADFEWICQVNINDMPAYMYVSQLQQDKDVVAQAESIQWLALKEGHPLISSILVKTLMDSRYFHGIRTLAAEVMALSARPEIEWIGFFHLKKAFQELFCIPGSPMTRSNNFSDRSSYIIQCAIPRAIARIKGAEGRAPMFVKRFLLDVMRYNDNRGNDFSDDHYLSTLMLCLAQSLADMRKAANLSSFLSFEERNEEAEFQKKALEELNRHQRLDEWIPTYQNVYTTTALECGLILMKSRAVSLKASEFLQYTRIGNADNVRLKAWDCLVQLGTFRKEAIMRYMVNDIASEPSPFFRASLIHILDTALGQVAIGDEFKPEKTFAAANGGLVIEQEESLPDREAQFARRKLDGALRALKNDYAKDEAFKDSIKKALHSKTTSICDVQELLEICGILYLPVSELKITLRYPRYWAVQHVGHGRLRFYETGRIRDKPRTPFPPVQPQVQKPQVQKPHVQKPQAQKPQAQKSQAPALPPPPPIPQESPAPVVAPKLGLKLKLSNKIKAPAAEEVATPAVAEPEPPVKATPHSLPPPPPPPPQQKPPASLSPPPPPVAPAVKEKKGLKLSFGKAKKSESPASAPSPAPPIKPSPSPAPSLSAIPSPPPPPAPIPTQKATPKPARESTPVIRVQKKATHNKKSKIVVLKVPSNKLSDLAKGIRIAPSISPTPGIKRKAEHPPDGPGRNLKRQASEEPLMNGYLGRASNQNGTGRPSWSLVVKLNIGQDNASRLREKKMF